MTTINAHPEHAARLTTIRAHMESIDLATFDRLDSAWSKLPDHQHRGAELENVHQDIAVQAGALDFIENPDWKTLVIVGGYGTGKTWLATAIANELHYAGDTVKIATARDIVASLKPGGRTKIDRYLEPDLLVMDGLAEVPLSDWDQGQLRAIMLDRYANGRQTIVTTNCAPAELRELVGGAVWSRLCERPVLALNGDDRRDPDYRPPTEPAVGIRRRLQAITAPKRLPEQLRAEALDWIDDEIGRHPADPDFTAEDATGIREICAEVAHEALDQLRPLTDWIAGMTDEAITALLRQLHGYRSFYGRPPASRDRLLAADFLLSATPDQIKDIERAAACAEVQCRIRGAADMLAGTLVGNIFAGFVDDAIDEKRLPRRQPWNDEQTVDVVAKLAEAIAHGDAAGANFHDPTDPAYHRITVDNHDDDEP